MKIQGEFIWHSHADSDEMLLVVHGVLDMEFRDELVKLVAGELIVVPRGVEHRPRSQEECLLLVLDREGEPNTGSDPSPMTRARLDVF